MEQEMAALYTRHAPSLLRYACTLTNDESGAQDALQEIFLRYFVARSEGQQFVDPKAWLFRVLRNHLLDTLKSSSVKNEVAMEENQESADFLNDPERHYHRTEMVRDLTRLLAPRELECVKLRAEGLSYDEIAEILDLRQGTVGETLARAHKKVRDALGREDLGRNALTRVVLSGNDSVKETAMQRTCTVPREENSYSS
jgi:RNA polymerase sigma-70 factor (ECF subfamily)